MAIFNLRTYHLKSLEFADFDGEKTAAAAVSANASASIQVLKFRRFRIDRPEGLVHLSHLFLIQQISLQRGAGA